MSVEELRQGDVRLLAHEVLLIRGRGEVTDSDGIICNSETPQ